MGAPRLVENSADPMLKTRSHRSARNPEPKRLVEGLAPQDVGWLLKTVSAALGLIQRRHSTRFGGPPGEPNGELARASKSSPYGIFRLKEALGCLTVWFAADIVTDGRFDPSTTS
jgi:hypothetical protein